ncbi:hypothetical protein PIN31115_04468 [Pandoraea iniqua]|uniref:Uncharacterized protein n=1 Tax=Pandoraea iniqua TaxID=2508288 RepID=A0A5E4YGB6_9BURK|nr:hypothetical protein [Pandoraea iniqua]VVE47492.1 hypothetical protein PIN31115_04468 [Pandoraea iniqua]
MKALISRHLKVPSFPKQTSSIGNQPEIADNQLDKLSPRASLTEGYDQTRAGQQTRHAGNSQGLSLKDKTAVEQAQSDGNKLLRANLRDAGLAL